MNTALVTRRDAIDEYVAEINKYPLLTREEELELANFYRQTGDVAAAHRLVVSNLRFVVKVAHQYRAYGFKLLDLIQEGNIGLMMAVKKFEPERGYRLISYAVWWIRAQIRSFIVRSWSLVKMGTTFAQRKLFFSLRGAKSKAQSNEQDASSMAELVSHELGVSQDEFHEMEMRLAARDFSLDAKVNEESQQAFVDGLRTPSESQEEQLVQHEQEQLLRSSVGEVMDSLNDKERAIVERRFLSDEPATLQEIGDHFNVSRERVRQIEDKLKKRLRVAMDQYNGEPVAA